MKRFYLILMGIFALVLACGTLLIVRWTQDIPDETLAAASFTAAIFDAGGVDPSSAFLITFPEKVSSTSVRRCLTVSPEIPLGVHQGTNRSEVLVSPDEPLAADTVYTFQLTTDSASYQWAFQTKAPLTVAESSPAMQESQVAVDSKICFALDHGAALDLAAVGSYFSILPEVAGSFSQNGRVLVFTPDAPLSAGTVYTVQLAEGLPTLDSDTTLSERCVFSFETAGSSSQEKWHATIKPSFTPTQAPSVTLSLYDTSLLDIASAAVSGSTGKEAEAAEAAEKLAHMVQADLYQLPNATACADLLAESATLHPSWGEQAGSLAGCDLSAAKWLAKESLQMTQSNRQYALQWPATLPEGCYLFTLTYYGQTQSLLFCVSGLNAYTLAWGNETLFWLHDAAGVVSDATISDAIAGTEASTDKNGLATLARAEQDAIYVVEHQGQALILQLSAAEDAPGSKLWRYLYLDQAAYQNGDTLYYWGLVQPRNGADLPYGRVSVYMVPAEEENAAPIWTGYAELAKGCFSGEIVLPTLLKGNYCLQIRQDGNTLVEERFSLGTEPTAAAQPESAASLLQSDFNGVYASTYTLTAEQEEETLFIERSGAITDAQVRDDGIYNGKFEPENQLNCGWTAVRYQNGAYLESAPLRLTLDYSQRALQLKIAVQSQNPDAGTATVGVTVTDADGKPVAGIPVSLLYTNGNKPEADPLSRIYTDYAPDGAAIAQAADTQAGGTKSFSQHTTDENGLAIFSASGIQGGPGWLLAQALDAGSVLRAGSNTLRLEGTAATEPALAAKPTVFRIETGTLSEEQTLASGLVILSSPARTQHFDTLLRAIAAQEAAGPEPDSTAAGIDTTIIDTTIEEETGEQIQATALAATEARRLLQDLFDVQATQLLGSPTVETELQEASSGALATPRLTALALLLNSNSVSTYWLERACTDWLQDAEADRFTRICALAGEAAAGKPVLNELKALLTEEDLDTVEQLWLIIGLYCAGDIRSAQQAMVGYSPATSDSAEIWITAALTAACLGDTEKAASRLTQAESRLATEEEYILEQVLVVRALLPKTAFLKEAFTFETGAAVQTVTPDKDRDFLLYLDGPVVFRALPEDLGYCHIY